MQRLVEILAKLDIHNRKSGDKIVGDIIFTLQSDAQVGYGTDENVGIRIHVSWWVTFCFCCMMQLTIYSKLEVCMMKSVLLAMIFTLLWVDDLFSIMFSILAESITITIYQVDNNMV